MVVFWQNGCIRGEWLYSGKVDIFGQGGCIRTKVVVFGKNCCIRSKIVVIGQSGCIWEKVVVIGQRGCIRQSGFIRAKWLFSGKEIVCG